MGGDAEVTVLGRHNTDLHTPPFFLPFTNSRGFEEVTSLVSVSICQMLVVFLLLRRGNTTTSVRFMAQCLTLHTLIKYEVLFLFG